jgi:Fe/S biogenesis protein NfuA
VTSTDAPTESSAPEHDETILAVTATALATVLEVRATEDDPEATALRVGITGANMTDFQYALDLVPIAEAASDDVIYTQGSHGELTVIVPADSVDKMRGATLDVPGTGQAGGLVIRNPNTPNPLDGLDLDLTGELPEKIQAVLDQAINPALGAHGGFATLVGVDGSKAIITMGGGCQGCAASAMTLREGITKMLMEALPEISDVIDATDHTAGENPFYT